MQHEAILGGRNAETSRTRRAQTYCSHVPMVDSHPSNMQRVSAGMGCPGASGGILDGYGDRGMQILGS
eukprot:9518029-Karenia_brevis.AAC.1